MRTGRIASVGPRSGTAWDAGRDSAPPASHRHRSAPRSAARSGVASGCGSRRIERLLAERRGAVGLSARKTPTALEQDRIDATPIRNPAGSQSRGEEPRLYFGHVLGAERVALHAGRVPAAKSRPKDVPILNEVDVSEAVTAGDRQDLHVVRRVDEVAGFVRPPESRSPNGSSASRPHTFVHPASMPLRVLSASPAHDFQKSRTRT